MSPEGRDRTAPTPPDGDMDVEGHGLHRVMGLDQVRRTDRATTREQVEPDLPPITKRFPDMRSEPRAPRHR